MLLLSAWLVEGEKSAVHRVSHGRAHRSGKKIARLLSPMAVDAYSPAAASTYDTSAATDVYGASPAAAPALYP